jgi:hypothetical protein
MTTTPTVTRPDNGYFEIWARSCGHEVRVTTEYEQWERRTRRGYRAASQARTRDRLAARPCGQCAALACELDQSAWAPSERNVTPCPGCGQDTYWHRQPAE